MTFTSVSARLLAPVAAVAMLGGTAAVAQSANPLRQVESHLAATSR